MESLTVAATAVVAAVVTKAFEKTGEKLGEKVFVQSEKFFASLRKESPKTASAIQRVAEGAAEKPLDYGTAVLEAVSQVKALSESDSEIANEILSVAEAAQQDTNLKLTEITQEIVSALKSQSLTVKNMEKLAEKIAVVVQGGQVSINEINM